MRILIVSHGHPDISVGGGEIAAHRQATTLRAAGHEVLFMARAPGVSGRGGTPFAVRAGQPDDVLFHSPHHDHFLQSQRAKWAVHRNFRSLLESFRPEIVHFHHYVHLGVELLREVRKFGPDLPIVLTLHEYLAICENHGQMTKMGDGGLCERATPADCHACFPEHSPQDFFLRERFIRSHLNLADRFVCPSRFLLERYAAWGLAREKLVFVENGQPVPEAAPKAEEAPADLARRFAFFGQITEFKGIRVFLEALRHLAPGFRRRAIIEIHGTIAHQAEEMQEEFLAEVASLDGLATYFGPYRQADLPALMRRVGWVVVPSIWWENSPLVIQEAFNHGRPVLCANIGGMAEKVTDGTTGLHFRAGHARDLARCMEEASEPALWSRLRANIVPPPSVAETMRAHLALYEQIRRERASSPAPSPVSAAQPSRPSPRGARRKAPLPA